MAPEEAAENGRAAAGAAAATGATASTADAAEEAASLLVVDATGQPRVICRDMLKMGSNVIVTRCMTVDDWKKFERQQMIEGQEMLRTMQRSAFR
jgi:hypothetical protein